LPFEGYKNFWEYVVHDTDYRYEMFKKLMDEVNYVTIRPMGTYYCLIDISSFRNKIPEEYYYKIDDKDIYTPELDKAFCRVLIRKYKIGLIPLSDVQASEGRIDFLIRVSLNRNEEDFKMVQKALEEMNEFLKSS
jgi:aspartate/methionine/tyrosine aminotransferase